MNITKAVIPIAGLGTRFYPIGKSIPKDMLPIVDRPIIDYIVDEAVKSGIKEIVFVINPSKEMTKHFFKTDEVLKDQLSAKNKTQCLTLLDKIESKAIYHFVYQTMPHGDGHAISMAEDIIGKEPFAILFGDDIIDNDPPCLKQLIDSAQENKASVIALQNVKLEEVSQYGIIDGHTEGKLTRINHFVEKPEPKNAPSTLGIVGKYVVTEKFWDYLHEAEPISKDGEWRLIDVLNAMIQDKQPLFGLEFEGERFDTGHKLGLLEAQIHFSLKDKEIGTMLKEYIKSKL